MRNPDNNRQLALKTRTPENGSGARQLVAANPTSTAVPSSSSGLQKFCVFCSQPVKPVSFGGYILEITRTKMLKTLCNHLMLDGLQVPDVLPKKLCTSCEMRMMRYNDCQREMERIQEEMAKIIAGIQETVATDQILRPKLVSSSDLFFEIRNALWEGYKQKLRDLEEKELQQSGPHQDQEEIPVKDDDVIEKEIEKNQEEKEVIEIGSDDEEDTTAEISAALGLQDIYSREEDQLQLLPRDDQNDFEQGNEVGIPMEHEVNVLESGLVGADVLDQTLDSYSVPLIEIDSSEEEEEPAVASTSAEYDVENIQEEQAVPPPKQVLVTVPTRVETHSVKNRQVPTILTATHCTQPSSTSTMEALSLHEQTAYLRPALTPMNFLLDKITPRTEKKKRAAAPAKCDDASRKKRGPGRPPKKQHWRKTVKITTPKPQAYKCEICSRTFPRRNYLMFHMKKHGIKGVNPSSISKPIGTPKVGVKMLRSKALQLRRSRKVKEKQVPEPGSAAEFFQYLGLFPNNGN